MPYVETTAQNLPNLRGHRVVLYPEHFDPDKIADRITYAAQTGDVVHGATRDGRFALNAASTVLVDPTT